MTVDGITLLGLSEIEGSDKIITPDLPCLGYAPCESGYKELGLSDPPEGYVYHNEYLHSVYVNSHPECGMYIYYDGPIFDPEDGLTLNLELDEDNN